MKIVEIFYVEIVNKTKKNYYRIMGERKMYGLYIYRM